MLATRGPCVCCCCSCTAESALQLLGRLASSMWKPAPRVIRRLEGLQQQGQQTCDLSLQHPHGVRAQDFGMR
jgi:hypothetical protein